MSAVRRKRLTRQDYTVGWICPLEVELSAARYLLDEQHQRIAPAENDYNQYVFGEVKSEANGEETVYNVVIGAFPAGYQGETAAQALANDMNRSFPAIQIRLLVGIGGGVPGRKDIRLGDVVVAEPTGITGGVVQYDLGKDTISGFQRKGQLLPPPPEWSAAVTMMKSDHRDDGNHVKEFLDKMYSTYPRVRGYRRPTTEDVLFKADFEHASSEPDCLNCDRSQTVLRRSRGDRADEPVIHYGQIATGNMVEKNGVNRDLISKRLGGVDAFEMEAAGMLSGVSGFQCIVIRGISDYADSHKNDDWHEYAAASAAAVAKELVGYLRLRRIPGSNSDEQRGT